MRIKAAVLRRTGVAPPYAETEPLSIETVELEPPGRDEVLVRIGAAGLCHSDLSVINGDRPRPLPMALGHEAAGVVEEVGEGVADLARGDHVVMVFMPSCGHCLPCAEGRPALCEPGAAANGAGTLLSGARRLRCDDGGGGARGGGGGEPPSRLLGLRRIRGGVAALAGAGSTRSCRSTRRRCSAARC